MARITGSEFLTLALALREPYYLDGIHNGERKTLQRGVKANGMRQKHSYTKSIMRAIFWVLVWGLVSCSEQGERRVKDGDIIFQTSRSSQSQAIQLATNSRYSHMGIIFLRQGTPYVFEANDLVRATPLQEWIQRGKGGLYVIKRVKQEIKVLTPLILKRMKAEGQRLAGKPYDLVFGWTDEKIYCSELVWKIYQRGAGLKLGHLQTLRDFDLSAPAVQVKLQERYGNQIPFEEPVVSPAAIFNSAFLEEVG